MIRSFKDREPERFVQRAQVNRIEAFEDPAIRRVTMLNDESVFVELTTVLGTSKSLTITKKLRTNDL